MQRVAIITGASRGIGKAIAEKLAREGIKVIANYNKSKNKVEELKQNLAKDGIEIDIFKADVSNKEQVKQMVNFAIVKYGKIDILVNNARSIPNKDVYRFNRWRY